MKRKYYYYTVHIGALPVGWIIADIDQISIQLNGPFICMYRIFWEYMGYICRQYIATYKFYFILVPRVVGLYDICLKLMITT